MYSTVIYSRKNLLAWQSTTRVSDFTATTTDAMPRTKRPAAQTQSIFKRPLNKRLLLIRGFFVLMGGFLIHLTLGTTYTFGNIIPYIVSYIRQRSHPAGLSAGTGTWIYALNLVGLGGSMFFGGWLERKIGPRFSTLIGGWLMSAGVLLSYFTIKVSFWLLLLTYGLTLGLGVGIAYVGPLSCAMRWFPRWKGVASGFIVAGYGLGALVFDLVQSHYINSHNLKPTADGYFTDHDLLDRVPFVFLILGGTYAVMQFIGSMLITNPPHDWTLPPPSEQLHTSQVQSSSKEGHREEVITPGTNDLRDSSVLTDSGQHQPKQALPADVEMTDSNDFALAAGECESLLIPKEEESTHNPASATTSESTSPRSSSFRSPTEVTNVHPFRMLRTLCFYHLWSMMLMAGFSVSFINALYKVFGLTFINDDHFLATVGSVSGVFNFAGRIGWGLVADKFSYKSAFVFRSGIITIFLLTFYATSAVGKPMFFIWVCAVLFCVGGIFSTYPTAIADIFGPMYMSINFGILFTSQVCSGLIAAFLFTTLEDILDWDGLILLISGFSMIGFLLAILFVRLDGKYHKI